MKFKKGSWVEVNPLYDIRNVATEYPKGFVVGQDSDQNSNQTILVEFPGWEHGHTGRAVGEGDDSISRYWMTADSLTPVDSDSDKVFNRIRKEVEDER